MTAPNASRQSVAVSSRLYSSGRAGLALARAASRIGPEFAARPPLSCTGQAPPGCRVRCRTVRIARLDHLVLTVADPEATVAFYERLGMEREVFDDDRLALRFGEQKINLHRAGRPINPPAPRPTPHPRRPPPGSADVCLLVEGSLDAVERELERAGVAFELGPVPRTGAIGPIRSLYLRDPDGNLVELSERI